jgi:dTDP-4-dehydrorhamnose 3,5-epimerase
VLYKTTRYYAQGSERSILWNDPELAVSWPIDIDPILSAKDAVAPLFADAETF